MGKTCKWTQEQYAVQSSLVMLCFYFLCVTVRLSFCEWKFLYERQGTVTAQTTFLLLDCLHLFLFIYDNKKGKRKSGTFKLCVNKPLPKS